MQVVLDDYVVGASFATDLVNTSPRVWVEAGDALRDPQALHDLLDEHGLSPDALRNGRRLTGGELADVQALREAIRSILDAPTSNELVDRTDQLLQTVPHHVRLVPDAQFDYRWNALPDRRIDLTGELTLLIGYSLLGTLRTLGYERFRPCASPTCNGVFVDTSRGGRRRYCMPALCGNRINVANHRQRQRRT
ncbi:CGNR zinc finger domain-containing protein [Rhodococcus erythropolis]|jgi:predicted RNA-binding Zn ribbon-like protein|uniref:CGNR zinc finger domain-containing protein n=1 Tax=Rhodococcus erythropolis TaxID=1833 RepID=UPI0018A319AE|nr:CGNR zinc finger domain-containing protein [Rhodococcus erythropolis]MBF7735520.1 CGNR zinc finger domain-containing protein [Rhodococcus erythropolis]MCZ4642325.1 CGNR zinc finger domain-containing protein [Rhodococcus erythropolis]